MELDVVTPLTGKTVHRMRVAERAQGAGPIPPNSNLLFEVELIATNRLAEIAGMMRAAAAGVAQ